MVKVIIRETIITLLGCLAVLLILSVALYNYIPSNKVVPEAIEYSPSKEIKNQLNAEVQKNPDEILVTYEITATDLDNFEKTDHYNPGKSNPFAPVSDKPTDTGDGTGTGSSNTGSGNTGNNNPGTGSSNGGSTNNNSGGSLFEGGSSK